MLRLAAMMEFDLAVENAAAIRLDESLVPPDGPTSVAQYPTVGDLLQAIRAARFEGVAHSQLGRLCLEQGDLERAEYHLDQSVFLGLAVLLAYENLAEQYTVMERPWDAARAYYKAMEHSVAPSANARRVLEGVWNGFWTGG